MDGFSRIGETLVGKVRLLAIMVLGGLVLVIIVQAEAVLTTGEAVNRSMRYDIAMNGLNGKLDAANALERVSRFAATGAPEDAQAARLFHNILLSRIDTSTGEVRAPVSIQGPLARLPLAQRSLTILTHARRSCGRTVAAAAGRTASAASRCTATAPK